MRLKTLEQAEKLFIDEMPLIPLYHEDNIYIISPYSTFTIPLWGDLILQRHSIIEYMEGVFMKPNRFYQKERKSTHKKSKKKQIIHAVP